MVAEFSILFSLCLLPGHKASPHSCDPVRLTMFGPVNILSTLIVHMCWPPMSMFGCTYCTSTWHWKAIMWIIFWLLLVMLFHTSSMCHSTCESEHMHEACGSKEVRETHLDRVTCMHCSRMHKSATASGWLCITRHQKERERDNAA